MDIAEKPQPVLTEEEWDLVIELLERKRSELPIQIHHARARDFRDQLRKRLDLVDQLLQRLTPENRCKAT